MTALFCKKSVFSILFLFFFIGGTICGVLLLRAVFFLRPDWLSQYCTALITTEPAGVLRHLLFLVYPLLCVIAVGLTPLRRHIIPVLIALRGCLLAYSCSAFYVCGISWFAFLMRQLLLLPLFYLLCAFYCCRSSAAV